MRAGLVALLTGESTISSLVGTRVYPDHVPQGAALPHIIFQQITTDEYLALDGTPGLRAVDFEIKCKADRSVEAAALGDALRVFIDDYTGTAGSQTIDAVLVNDESTEFEPPQDGSDRGVYVTTLDLTIQYSPA